MRRIIREYYKQKPLEEPSDLHKREIAIESLEDGVYIRHLAFPYMSALYDYITNVKTPLHLYYSSAIYAVPDADRMENKVWEGSELLFDIDADKYEGCNQKLWVCPGTGDVYVAEPQVCPSEEKPVELPVLPWVCIARAWNNVLSLVNVLREELGFNKVKVYFSGNRGFHVKTFDPEVLLLSREARKSVADYISCEGLVLEKMFPAYRGKVVFGSLERGLRKRVLDVAIRRGRVEKGTKKLKNALLVDLEEVQSILKEEVCINIDRAVTMDISRLSRFGNSLNMKAGLKVKELPLNMNVEELDFSDFSPFHGSIEVKSLVTGSVNVLGKKLDISRGNTYRVEAYVGVYLVVKGIALPKDTSDLEVKT